MPRLPRVVVAGIPLHLIQRGNNRSAVFCDTEDYRRYVAVLFERSLRYGCAIHAYVLMTNHVHLLLTPQDEHGPSRMMQAIGSVYVHYFNRRYNRTGTLWEGRYRSTTVDSDRYLLACSRYIELNPVRAHMVEHPNQHNWSSYRHNAEGRFDRLITQHAVHEALGAGPLIQREVYRALFETSLDPTSLDAIRRATNRGTALGDASFCDRVEAASRLRAKPLPRGGDRITRILNAAKGVRAVEGH